MRNIREIAIYFDCTLRELEKCYSKISYTFKITGADYDLYPIALSFLVMLSVKYHELFNSFKDNKMSLDSLFIELAKKTEKLNEFCNSDAGVLVWYELFTAKSRDDEISNKIKELSDIRDDTELPAWEKEVLNNRLQRLIDYPMYSDRDEMNYLIQNIDMVSNFHG